LIRDNNVGTWFAANKREKIGLPIFFEVIAKILASNQLQVKSLEHAHILGW